MAEELNDKQLLFCREYLVDLNATQAAIRAGYSERTARQQGQRLLTNAYIQETIQSLQVDRSKRTDITADYVLETIKETVERCRQAAPVLDRRGKQVFVETPDGQTLPAFIFDSKGVLKGCELLGNHLGIFKQNHDHRFPDGVPVEGVVLTAGMTDDDKAALITKAARRLK